MFQDLPFVKRAKDNDWRFLVENYASHGPGETIDGRVHILPGVERMCRHGSYRICVPRFPPTSGKRLLAASTAWANPRGVRLRDLHGRAGAADCELPSRGAGLQRGVSSVGGIRCRLVGGISFECCRRHLAKGRGSEFSAESWLARRQIANRLNGEAPCANGALRRPAKSLMPRSKRLSGLSSLSGRRSESRLVSARPRGYRKRD